MNDISIDNLSYEGLVALHSKLKEFQLYKKENMLDFMDWAAYPKQNTMRVKILASLMGVADRDWETRPS